MNILTAPSHLWAKIAQQLQPPQMVENMAIGFLGINRAKGHREFLLREVDIPAPSDYRVRSPASVELGSEKVAEVLDKSRHFPCLLFAHNHLFDAFISSTDEAGIRDLLRCYRSFRRDGCLIQMVWGTNGILARVADVQTGRWIFLDAVKVVGPEGLRLIPTLNARHPLQSFDKDRQLRTLTFLGERGEEVLNLVANLAVGVIGVGGNGAAATYLLKFLGFKRWVLVDPDHIEPHNANRFFGFRVGDEGRPKVGVVMRELLSFDPSLHCLGLVFPFPSLEAIEALKPCDLILCCPDNNWVRLQAAQFCARYHKVLVEVGAGIELGGDTKHPRHIGCQVRLQVPGGPCLVCNGLSLEQEDPFVEAIKRAQGRAVGYVTDADLPNPGSVVSLNAMAATLLVRVLLGYLAGLGTVPTYLFYDDLRLKLVDASSPRCPDCPLCGEHPNALFGWGDELPVWMRILRPQEVSDDGTLPEAVGGAHLAEGQHGDRACPPQPSVL